MKLRKFLAVLLVLVVMLAGCNVEEMIDDSAVRAEAGVLLDAFAQNDYEACRAVVDASVSDADLEAVFPAVAAEMAQLGSYEMTAVGWNRKVSNGEGMTSVQYLVSGEGGKYYLNVTALDGQEGLAGFQLTAADDEAQATTPAGPVHWVFMAVGAAVLGFTMWMVVDCVRRKMKRKWLWIPLILLGTMLLTLTVQDGLSFKFNIGLYLGLSSLSTFAAGGFQLKLYVPVCAIVYFLKRKELTLKDAEEVPAVEIADAEEAE